MDQADEQMFQVRLCPQLIELIEGLSKEGGPGPTASAIQNPDTAALDLLPQIPHIWQATPALACGRA
jgi:hypothetical protein